MRTASYADIQSVLDLAHSVADAAEAHGTLAGSLCATVGYRFEDWLTEILPEGSSPPAGTDALRDLFRGTEQALGESQMQFEPLLPPDEHPLDERTSALAQWCQGFLYGLGTSSIQDVTRLPGELGEVVRDFSEITRAGVDASDSDESNESAYTELVEFVRAGVQLVFEELEPLREPPARPEATSLH